MFASTPLDSSLRSNRQAPFRSLLCTCLIPVYDTSGTEIGIGRKFKTYEKLGLKPTPKMAHYKEPE